MGLDHNILLTWAKPKIYSKVTIIPKSPGYPYSGGRLKVIAVGAETRAMGLFYSRYPEHTTCS